MTLNDIGKRSRELQDRVFNHPSPEQRCLAFCEEMGEVARVVLKTGQGIRPETRGNLADEVGDALLTILALADFFEVDADAAAARRLDYLASLDYTKHSEGTDR